MSYRLSVIAPTGKVFEDEVDSTIAPGEEGFLEVLSHHAPMVARLKAGPLTLRQNGQRREFAIGPGVIEVSARHDVLLLTDSAKPQ